MQPDDSVVLPSADIWTDEQSLLLSTRPLTDTCKTTRARSRADFPLVASQRVSSRLEDGQHRAQQVLDKLRKRRHELASQGLTLARSEQRQKSSRSRATRSQIMVQEEDEWEDVQKPCKHTEHMTREILNEPRHDELDRLRARLAECRANRSHTTSMERVSTLYDRAKPSVVLLMTRFEKPHLKPARPVDFEQPGLPTQHAPRAGPSNSRLREPAAGRRERRCYATPFEVVAKTEPLPRAVTGSGANHMTKEPANRTARTRPQVGNALIEDLDRRDRPPEGCSRKSIPRCNDNETNLKASRSGENQSLCEAQVETQVRTKLPDVLEGDYLVSNPPQQTQNRTRLPALDDVPPGHSKTVSTDLQIESSESVAVPGSAAKESVEGSAPASSGKLSNEQESCSETPLALDHPRDKDCKQAETINEPSYGRAEAEEPLASHVDKITR